jgi:hypothetical protein
LSEPVGDQGSREQRVAAYLEQFRSGCLDAADIPPDDYEDYDSDGGYSVDRRRRGEDEDLIDARLAF